MSMQCPSCLNGWLRVTMKAFELGRLGVMRVYDQTDPANIEHMDCQSCGAVFVRHGADDNFVDERLITGSP